MAAVRPAQRPGGRSAVVRRAVHGAALALLDEVGLAGFGIPEVAVRAGVNKTSIYRRWPTKVALVADAIESTVAADAPVPDLGSLRGDLAAYLVDTAAVLRTRTTRALVAAVLADGEGEPHLAAARDRFWAGRFERSAVIVERAIARGELPHGTEPHWFLEQAASPLHFRLLVSGEPVDAAFIDRLVAESCSDG